jgi:hypothetical protein
VFSFIRKLEKRLSDWLTCDPRDTYGTERYDAVVVVPFGVSRNDPTLPSGQTSHLLTAASARRRIANPPSPILHVGGGHPHPGTCESEGQAQLARYGNPSYMLGEDQSLDTGDNAWYLRQTVIERQWHSILLVVVKEQSRRAYDDFQEYLAPEYVGWHVQIYVHPIDCLTWENNIKFTLRNKWRFMIYEAFKLMLRRLLVLFVYKHKPWNAHEDAVV